MFFGGFVILCLVFLILSTIIRISFGKNRILRILSTMVIVLSISIPTILMLLMAFGNQFHYSGKYYSLDTYEPVAEMELKWTGNFNIKIYNCQSEIISGTWEYDYNDSEDYIRLNMDNKQTLKCVLDNKTVNVNLKENGINCNITKFQMRRKN